MLKVIKDYSGFVWLMSNDRVHRFDGKHMKDYKLGERVSSIFCDSRNQVWANSAAAIYRFTDDHKGFVRIAFDTAGGIVIGRLFQLPDKELWVHTTKGMYEWDHTGQTFKKITLQEFDIPFPVSAGIFSQSGHTVFLATRDSVFAIDASNHSRMAMVSENNRGMYAVSNKLLLITGRGSISSWYDFDLKKITAVDVKKDIPGKKDEFLFIRDAQSINDTQHLLATHSGLMEVNSSTRRFKQLQLYNKGKPLDPTPYYNDLFLDPDKKVWLMHGSGLISFTPGQETIGLIRNRETVDEKIWLNNVRNFAEDEKRNLWISTSQGFGYWNFKNNSITMYPAKEGATDRLNQPSVRGLVYDGRNLIMGTSNGGVWLYEPSTKKYRRPVFEPGSKGDSVRKKLENDFLQQIFILPDKQYLIIGKNVYRMNDKTYQVQQLIIPGSNETSNFAYSDTKKNIWLCTARGMYCFDSMLSYKTSIKFGQEILTMCEYKNGEYFAGTLNGLYRVKMNAVNPVAVRDYFIPEDTRISFIINDAGGKYWIGSDEGLSRYDPEKKLTELFDYADNVQGNTYAWNSGYYNKAGQLFLGGNNGINYFHPEKIIPQKENLQVTILKVVVNGNDSSYFNRGSSFSLKYFQNSIDVEYVAPYFGNNNRLQYRYRLLGLDSAWKNNGNSNTIRFTALPPGDYTFSVAASINGDDWHESKESFRFTIASPFWKTWWFKSAAVLLLLLSALWFYRWRIKKIKGEEKLKTDYEKKIAETEMQALRAQMNPHFMFNSLNSINNFILKNDPDNASGYLTKFSRLMRLILDNSRSEWVLLENELKSLELYIQLEAVRFDHAFSYSIEVNQDINTETVIVPPLIVQPYVENAIWHGLLHRKEPGGKLDIHLWKNNGILYIEIEDNGVGRDEAMRQKSKTATKQKSHGMKITAERIDIVNKVYNVDAGVAITDVKNETGGNGTRVLITLKYKTNDSHNSG